MTATGGGSLLLTDPDVDIVAWQFLSSRYADDTYANWPLDQRLEGYLRHRGMARVADDGDTHNVLLDRVMTHLRATPQVTRESMHAV